MKAGLWLRIPLMEWQPILGEFSSTVGFIMLISDLLSLASLATAEHMEVVPGLLPSFNFTYI